MRGVDNGSWLPLGGVWGVVDIRYVSMVVGRQWVSIGIIETVTEVE